MGLYRSTHPLFRELQDRYGRLSAAEGLIADHLHALAGRLHAESDAAVSRGTRDEAQFAAAMLDPAARRSVRAELREMILDGVMLALGPALPDPARRDLVRRALLDRATAFEDSAAAPDEERADAPPDDSMPAAGEGSAAPERGAGGEESADAPISAGSPGEMPPEATQRWRISRLEGASRALRDDLHVRGRAIVAREFFGEPPGALEPDIAPIPAETAPTFPRFIALAFDSFIGSAIAVIAVVVWNQSFPESSEASAVFMMYASVFLYAVAMAMLIATLRASPGKYAMGLEVVADDGSGEPVPLLRAIGRETIGRIVNGLIFGLGYLTALASERRLTWADRMVQTRVIRNPVRRPRRSWVTGVALLCGLIYIGTVVETRDQDRPSHLEGMFERLVAIMEQRASVEAIYVRSVADTIEYARDMRAVLERLPQVDLDLASLRGTARRLHAASVAPWTGNRRLLAALDSLVGVLQHQSRLRRQAALAVLDGGFEGARPRYFREIQYLDGDVEYLDLEFTRLADRVWGDGS